MNVTFKSIQWIILTSIVSIFLGILTFFTFINQSFIELNEINLQIFAASRQYKVESITPTDLIITMDYGAGNNRWNVHLKK